MSFLQVKYIKGGMIALMEKVIGLIVIIVLTLGIIGYAIIGNSAIFKEQSEKGINEYNRDYFYEANNILTRDKAKDLFEKRDILKFDVYYENLNYSIIYGDKTSMTEFKIKKVLFDFEALSEDTLFSIVRSYQKEGRLLLTFKINN